jgi:hypothetical protein
MDYKYIEQLIERYWQCETSLLEEQILRSFFSQEEIPANLLPYREVFVYQQTQQEVKISADFDEKVLAAIEAPVVKARHLTLVSRFMPLMKAAAMVAFVITLGSVAQRSFFAEDKLDYNYATYKDTYKDPQMAYEQLSSALMKVSKGIKKSQAQLSADSILDVKSERDSVSVTE